MCSVIAEHDHDRQHRPRLRRLLESSDDPVRIASAYVTDRELLLGTSGQEIRLVTSLVPMDIASGENVTRNAGRAHRCRGGVQVRPRTPAVPRQSVHFWRGGRSRVLGQSDRKRP